MRCVREDGALSLQDHRQAGTLVAPLKIHSVALSDLQVLCGVGGERTSGPQALYLLLQSICFKGAGQPFTTNWRWYKRFQSKASLQAQVS